MNPIIGVTSNLIDQQLCVSMDNIDALTGTDAVPLVLPNLLDMAMINSIAGRLDGLLVSGGGDIDPTLFGEEPHRNLGIICPERDSFEINIIKKMLVLDKPILAICRGCQILNIAVGGDMYQDIYDQHDRSLLQHAQKAPRWHASHYVNVKADSLLFQITQKEKFKVNSFHHQAVRRIPVGFEACAMSSDGVMEAFESKTHAFVLGIQWHPESMVMRRDRHSISIFETFIEACKQNRIKV
ncbi:gamma-glutamyl-gamma-aminobutyrate hydrolase [Bacillus canaveralius]|uniref:Gamma-glutamyl-gamma-aminobutyrate hydrolase n=1 Tax=Bacillus canaveralius TaxID=1403243 RepID=A0A2N5GKT0_9BACI|nr:MULTISPECIES: gamma-glutamyl-gamma-aminobutyrate hydrolase family protein [Bacillus]PLR81470.1 gamma-glutamyl-gamma-aminobutyrate hydrolase [Bacillus sp. V33-4]PLR82080.1 gamma-glutamyl-gamma-aminobutyrate hydrolase [Bacillus canaveralius]PLR98014.1 gamma-glutamyl-gamma-aminobutyrate hydrolase [Bacillus canaveralius]RSK54405.1 gamma-glutamyl-gamma-aminobutyrate hydrolase family protein [Bacillus canaveralius]